MQHVYEHDGVMFACVFVMLDPQEDNLFCMAKLENHPAIDRSMFR